MWSAPACCVALAALLIAPASAQVPDSASRLPDLKVTVTCPFISAWIRRHPDYQELLRR